MDERLRWVQTGYGGCTLSYQIRRGRQQMSSHHGAECNRRNRPFILTLARVSTTTGGAGHRRKWLISSPNHALRCSIPPPPHSTRICEGGGRKFDQDAERAQTSGGAFGHGQRHESGLASYWTSGPVQSDVMMVRTHRTRQPAELDTSSQPTTMVCVALQVQTKRLSDRWSTQNVGSARQSGRAR